MTDGILATAESFTGHRPPSCPWAALRDPFVGRVIDSIGPAEDGYLALFQPEPSNRLIEGVAFYRRTDSRIYAQQLKSEREARERGGHG